MNESESSEDELYSKKEPPRSVKKEAVPLLELNHPVRNPTSNQTLAEWAVDNMCYNPGIYIYILEIFDYCNLSLTMHSI